MRHLIVGFGDTRTEIFHMNVCTIEILNFVRSVLLSLNLSFSLELEFGNIAGK